MKKKDIFEEFMGSKDILDDFFKLGFADRKKSNLDKEAEKIIDKAIRSDDMSGIDKLFGNLLKDLPASGNPGGKNPMRNFAKSQRKTPWVNGPRPRQQEILNIALKHVESVPYAVSTRWIFYRLYQEGLYKTKDDYTNWIDLSGKARHSQWGGWNPWTLADDTRKAIDRVYGLPDKEEAIGLIPSHIRDLANISIDHFYHQERYIELWYEARAMTGQFKHYTDDIDLVPMAGQPSISFKYHLAKRLRDKAGKYDLPITILYFGDEDLSGHKIMQDIEEDLNTWATVGFDLVWCGLTEAQAKKYGVPKSVEKKGYQWEALSDEAAGEIISEAMSEYISQDVIDDIEAEVDEANETISVMLDKVADDVEALLKK